MQKLRVNGLGRVRRRIAGTVRLGIEPPSSPLQPPELYNSHGAGTPWPVGLHETGEGARRIKHAGGRWPLCIAGALRAPGCDCVRLPRTLRSSERLESNGYTRQIGHAEPAATPNRRRLGPLIEFASRVAGLWRRRYQISAMYVPPPLRLPTRRLQRRLRGVDEDEADVAEKQSASETAGTDSHSCHCCS